ncbi:hypothetical protein B0H16DRAFT_1008269 [Mycena metata]|uniref:Uncharacterized protein n=1 Tax=Mycena metata TaxID=1033252 RepID=A0AAD7II05_9AGAR|nr:hypothetical protein B0H16DRAFT_1008269 [Mycena metata]
MSASRPKDRVTYIAIREIPPHIPKESFEANVRALTDSFYGAPGVQEERSEIRPDLSNTVVGCEPARAGIPGVRAPCSFHRGMRESRSLGRILSDPEFIRIVTEGERFGFCSSACCFFADVATKIDSPAEAVNPICLFAVFKAPTRLSQQQYFQKLGELVDRTVALPICQKVFTKYKLHTPSNLDINLQNVDNMLRALDFSAPESVAVFITEARVSIPPSLLSLA